MCNWLSAIVMKNGDVNFNLWTDSHEDLVRLFKLRDTKEGNFARVEFTPKSPDDLDKPDKYVLKIDEAREPGWFSEEMKQKTVDKLKQVLSRVIIGGGADLLCGGVFVLAKGARIACVKNSIIKVMMPESNVGEMWESSNVGEMWESSKVGVMRESSKVGVMWGSSKVGEMWESSNVGEMWESSNVGVMRESSKVLKDLREKNQTV